MAKTKDQSPAEVLQGFENLDLTNQLSVFNAIQKHLEEKKKEATNQLALLQQIGK